MISKMHEFILGWDEFKEIVEENNIKGKDEYDLIAYRGHANHIWELKPTLARFLGDSITEIRASHYYAVLREIYNCKKISGIRE
ncbi:MAG: hypothetical protein K2X37_12590 [Chitinophagaceae bacterium]|nr:hypothetical protein [Chitinophagaceae bacterium]